MLITVHNLPSSTRYTDLKALLKAQCGLNDGYVLDNLVGVGTSKKVTIGLAEEEDAALLFRKLNGYNYKGNSLYVQDVKKNTNTSEQSYHTSASNVGESSKMTNKNQSETSSMNQWMMSTPFYNMQSQNPFYTMPQQTSFMGYGTQQQQTMYQANQLQYSNQGYGNSQAPLGFRSGGILNNLPWYQQSNSATSYVTQDDSNRRPEKRSLDISGDTYTGLDKKSKWDDSYKSEWSAHNERPRLGDSSWQETSRDDNRNRSDNTNDYDRRYDDRKGYGHSNDNNSYSSQPAERGRYSGQSYEPDRGYDRPNEYRRDAGRSTENTENYDNYSNRSNFGQFTDRDRKYGRDNEKERSQNRVARPIDKEFSQHFNKFHWPPVNAGTSNDPPSRSSDFQEGRNRNDSRGERQNSNSRIRVWENSSHPFNQQSISDSQNRFKNDFKKAPDAKTKSSKKLPPVKSALKKGVTRRGLAWRSQAVAALAKQVLANVGYEAQNSDLVVKRLKEAIRPKVDKVARNCDMPLKQIIEKYRTTFVPYYDRMFFKSILEQVRKEQAAASIDPKPLLKSIPGISRAVWVEGEKDPTYKPELDKGKKQFGVRAQKRALKKALRKAERKNAPKVVNRQITVTRPAALSDAPPPRRPPVTRSAKIRAQNKPAVAQDGPGGAQNAPDGAQNAPGGAQDAPGGVQNAPGGAQIKPIQSKPLLPSYPHGDKKLFQVFKKQMLKELKGELEFALDPTVDQVMDDELEPIAQYIKTANVSYNEEFDSLFKHIQESEVIDELKKTLRIQVSRRLLNCGKIAVRVYGSPRMPNKTKLAQFLLPYGVISLKNTKRFPMFVATCKTYACADRLLNTEGAVLDGQTLTFKPMQMVAPPEKVKNSDIIKYRHFYIKSQIDNRKIDILKSNDGKPYNLQSDMDKLKKEKLKTNKKLNSNEMKDEAIDKNSNGAEDLVETNEGTTDAGVIEEEDANDDNVTEVKEDITEIEETETENICESIEENESKSTLKVESKETEALSSNKTEDTAEEMCKKAVNENKNNNELKNTETKPSDKMVAGSTNDKTAGDCMNNDSIQCNENNEPSDVDLDLNELNDDDLEDY